MTPSGTDRAYFEGRDGDSRVCVKLADVPAMLERQQRAASEVHKNAQQVRTEVEETVGC